MKEFEEWINNPDTKFWLDDYAGEERSEAIWKAALEWAYSQETDLNATEIGDAILRELGDE